MYFFYVFIPFLSENVIIKTKWEINVKEKL